MIHLREGMFAKYYPKSTDGITVPPVGWCVSLVAAAWNEKCVNLSVFNREGVPRSATSVPVVQEDDDPPDDPKMHYCRPMTGG